MEIQLGKILKPQGIKGELKVFPMSNPEFFKKVSFVKINGQELKIERVSIRDDGVYLKLDKINNRNEAECYRDKIILVDREILPELNKGQYFYDDLIGCEIVFADGEKVGEIVDIENYGTADIFEIKQGFGTILVPFVDGLFDSIDTKSKQITVNRKRFLEVTDYED